MEIPQEFIRFIEYIRVNEPHLAEHLSDLDIFVLLQLAMTPSNVSDQIAFIVKGTQLSDQSHENLILPPYEELSIGVLEMLGKKSLTESNLESAETIYKIIVDKAKTSLDVHNEALGLYGLGCVQATAGNPEKAIHIYRDVLDLIEPLEKWEFKGMVHQVMASELFQKGDFSAGLDSYNMAIQNYEKIGNKELIGWTKNNLANEYLRICDYITAIPIYDDILRDFHEMNYEKGIEHIYLNLGIANVHYQRFEAAIESLTEGLEIATRHSNWRCMCDIHEKLGEIHTILGNIWLATGQQVEVGKLQVMQNQMKKAGCTYANVAIAYKDSGDIPNAVFYYTKALSILEGEKAMLQAAKVCINLGYIYRSTNQEDLALRSFTKAKAYFEEENDMENANKAEKLINNSF